MVNLNICYVKARNRKVNTEWLNLFENLEWAELIRHDKNQITFPGWGDG